MEPDHVRFLFGYHYWATDIILDAAGKVSPAQFTLVPEVDPGRGSLRGILVHNLDSEISWRHALQKLEPLPGLAEADIPDLLTLTRHWLAERENWLSFCNTLDRRKLNAAYTYQFGDGPVRRRFVWQTIAHVLNHGAQHRSEAAWLLTGYGQSPGDLTFNYYVHLHGNSQGII